MNKITFYDTETTDRPVWKEPSGGKNQPHLVQLAAIQCNLETEEIIQSFNVIIKPEGWISSEKAFEAHQITTDYALGVGIPEPLAVRMLLELCQGSLRVSHNRTFDQRMIRIALKRYFDEPDVVQWAEKDDHPCTMLMSKPIMEMKPKTKWGYKNPKLEEAYKYFTGKELGSDAHSAIHDTRACMEIYFAMTRKPEGSKPETPVENPCPECKKEWKSMEVDECPHCGNVVPF